MGDPATEAFQRSLPLALLAVSPSLAALHAHRLPHHPTEPQAAADDPLTASTCAKCGSLLIPPNGSIRLTRTRPRPSHSSSQPNKAIPAAGPRRRLTRSCNVCGFTDLLHLTRSPNQTQPSDVSTTIGSFEPARTLSKRRRAAALSSAHLPVLPGPDNVPQTTPTAPARSPLPTRVLSEPPIASPLTSSPLSSAISGKKNSKKKKGASALQDMLERNRQLQEQRREREKRAGPGGGRLLGFLDGF